MSKKNTPQNKQQGNQRHQHSNTNQAQRERIWQYLIENVRATTIELRAILDVMHPAGRIKELRAKGWEIHTIQEQHPTECGKMHRVAVYVLLRVPKHSRG